MGNKLIFFLFLLTGSQFLYAQEVPAYRSNAFAFNLTQYAINELNISYEHRFSQRHGLEINGGLIYVNKGLEKMAEDWTNTHLFSEHGFAARIGYRIWQKAKEGSKWNQYIEPMLVYKYLYFNSQWFKNGQENIYQNRFRHKFGFDFMWGERLKLSSAFSFDFFFGAGLRATLVSRNDLLIQESSGAPITPVPYGVDKNFYVRPSLSGGIKLRMAF